MEFFNSSNQLHLPLDTGMNTFHIGTFSKKSKNPWSMPHWWIPHGIRSNGSVSMRYSYPSEAIKTKCPHRWKRGHQERVFAMGHGEQYIHHKQCAVCLYQHMIFPAFSFLLHLAGSKLWLIVSTHQCLPWEKSLNLLTIFMMWGRCKILSTTTWMRNILLFGLVSCMSQWWIGSICTVQASWLWPLNDIPFGYH